MTRDDEALREHAERIAAVFAASGFPRMAARVLMALTTGDRGATAAELAEQLDASAASVSGAVRYLQQMAMVMRVSEPGTRRDRYVLPQNPWYELAMGENRIYDAILAIADPAVEAAGGPGTAAGARLAEMAAFLRFIEARMPQLLQEWNAQRQDRLRTADAP